jgi:hypothetical protein
LLILVVSLTACGNAATSAPVLVEATQISATEAPVTETPKPALTAAAPALFQVIKLDGTKFDVTLDALKKLPLASITVDGKVQEGPKLMDVLALAGVTDFAEVTFTGSSASVKLTRDQVDNNTILDFSNRGTLKLATTHIPMPDWTKDISEITVK